MKKLQPYTRRQLGKVAAVGSASIPFLALARKSALAGKGDGGGGGKGGGGGGKGDGGGGGGKGGAAAF